jgi:membrane protease YdiL (CAAX protease family)
VQNASAVLLLVLIFVAMPTLGIASYFRLKSGKPLPPKNRRYLTTIYAEVILLVAAVFAAHEQGVTLFGPALPGPAAIVAGAVFIATLLTRIVQGWPKLKPERKQRLRLILPENGDDLKHWVWVALLAGVAEECAYRGAAYALLQRWTHSAAAALTLCVVSFAIAHMMQGMRSAVGVGIFGLVFHIVVFLTGGLYLAIAMHVMYDFALGVLLMKKIRADQIPAATPGATENPL